MLVEPYLSGAISKDYLAGKGHQVVVAHSLCEATEALSGGFFRRGFRPEGVYLCDALPDEPIIHRLLEHDNMRGVPIAHVASGAGQILEVSRLGDSVVYSLVKPFGQEDLDKMVRAFEQHPPKAGESLPTRAKPVNPRESQPDAYLSRLPFAFSP